MQEERSKGGRGSRGRTRSSKVVESGRGSGGREVELDVELKAG